MGGIGSSSQTGAIISLKNNRRRYQHGFDGRKNFRFKKNYILNFRSMTDEERIEVRAKLKKMRRIRAIKNVFLFGLALLITLGITYVIGKIY